MKIIILLICLLWQGGDIFSEIIEANVTEDMITLEFQRSDGTFVTQLIDFKNVNIIQQLNNNANKILN